MPFCSEQNPPTLKILLMTGKQSFGNSSGFYFFSQIAVLYQWHQQDGGCPSPSALIAEPFWGCNLTLHAETTAAR